MVAPRARPLPATPGVAQVKIYCEYVDECRLHGQEATLRRLMAVWRALRRWRAGARRAVRGRGAVLGQVPLRRGFRAWRRQRGVRSALAVRRTAHQRRWALCRAWGCWRLAAATERARTPPPPSHEASAEMSPVQAQLHWRQPLLLRSC